MNCWQGERLLGRASSRRVYRGEANLAIDAKPQTLPGAKRSPLGTHSVPIAERSEVQVLKETVQEVTKEELLFSDAVRKKTEGEMRRSGWQSHAFDFAE